MKEMFFGDIRIQPIGRCRLEYREGAREMTIGGDLQYGPFEYLVYVSSIGIWKDTGLQATDEERQRIVDNIRAAFAHNGSSVDFAYPTRPSPP